MIIVSRLFLLHTHLKNASCVVFYNREETTICTSEQQQGGKNNTRALKVHLRFDIESNF